MSLLNITRPLFSVKRTLLSVNWSFSVNRPLMSVDTSRLNMNRPLFSVKRSLLCV